MSNCYVVGVLDNGPQGLTPDAFALIQRADLLVGHSRTLSLFSKHSRPSCETRDATGALSSIPNWVQDALDKDREVVVLATGDPLCHGVGSYLAKKLGADVCKVVPNTTTLQLAFSRLGLAWQAAGITSIHGKCGGEWTPEAGASHSLYPLLRQIQKHRLLGVYTSTHNSPDRIARMLSELGLGESYEIAVAERLMHPDEKVHPFALAQSVTRQTFRSPNVAILRPMECQRPAVLFGLDDDEYAQRRPGRGLITKREVRAISLAQLQLRPDSIVWDIGAGSGSIGLEAARLCPDGYVYAIEKNEEDANIVRQNQRAFRLSNYFLTRGKAPKGLADWPDPDAIFIGGSGGELEALIELSLERLGPGGRLVMNFITFENLHRAHAQLERLGAKWELSQVLIARNRPLLDMQRLEALTPVWVASARRDRP